MDETSTKTNRETDFSLKSIDGAIRKELAEQKKGGPHTKLDQEKRRRLVFDYHFEKSFPAVKIAEMIGVNRNTINEDVKYLYSQISEELGEHTVDTWALMQYQRMESQRKRLLILLEDQLNAQGALVIEKMLSELDRRIDQFISPIISKYNVSKVYSEITDDIIKEIVRSLVLKGDVDKVTGYEIDKMLFDIIKMKRCDIRYARAIVSKMNDLGFELCKFPGDLVHAYDLAKFAMMRGIISENELKQIKKKIDEKREYENSDDDEETDQ